MRWIGKRGHRPTSTRGWIQLETIAATALIGAGIGIVATLNYRLLGVAKDSKHYQLALHEAANQIERIAEPGLQGLDQRIDQARIADDVARALPGATLQVHRIDDRTGTKVHVRIQWERTSSPIAVELLGWVTTRSVFRTNGESTPPAREDPAP